jgi:xanthine dehydrogenase accessory factor
MTDWLQSLPGEWPAAVCELLGTQDAVVRISVVQLRGSAPREAGASLLVTHTSVLGSVGGGQLEWQATQAAQALLRSTAAPAVQLLDFTLGPDLNQCCGGRVQLWLERFTRADLSALQDAATLLRDAGGVAICTHLNGQRVTRQVAVPALDAVPGVRLLSRADGGLTLVEGWQRQLPALWLFGAGHVGQAIVRLLGELALHEVTWIESRPGVLPTVLPAHVRSLHREAPAQCVAEAPARTTYLVLTHDHALDFALCRAVLARGDFRSLGLIGSASKRARFRSRLAREGLPRALIDRMACPIGMPGIHSKLPAAIAISVVAQLLAQQHNGAVLRLPLVSEPAVPACATDCGDCDADHRRIAR